MRSQIVKATGVWPFLAKCIVFVQHSKLYQESMRRSWGAEVSLMLFQGSAKVVVQVEPGPSISMRMLLKYISLHNRKNSSFLFLGVSNIDCFMEFYRYDVLPGCTIFKSKCSLI